MGIEVEAAGLGLGVPDPEQVPGVDIRRETREHGLGRVAQDQRQGVDVALVEPPEGEAAAADFREDVEQYRRPDPRLPDPPPGAVKKFRVDVFEHVTCVSDDQPATRVWSFGVNGELYRGTGASTPNHRLG